MKNKLLLSGLLFFSFYLLSSQVPQGINYEAIARDASGLPISGVTLQVKLSILSDTVAPVVVWEEIHNTVKTSPNGFFSIVLGTGVKSAGTALNFNSINWNTSPLYIKVQIYYSGAWKYMGSSKLWSVPYSLTAGDLTGSLKKLTVSGASTAMDEALFEVKNNTGQTVFAVYNEGVRAYVDNGTAKGAKGGFSIGGFGTDKGASQNFLTISPDSVRIYVDETIAKGAKGGFAIGGFNTGKGTVKEFMTLTPENYFIGHNSGRVISSGIYNSTLGYESGKSLTEGSNNVLLGYQSGLATNTGGSNVFIGTQTGYSNSSGDYNIALGRKAGYSSTTASSNILLGDLTAFYNTIGDQNVMIGDWAGYHNTEGWQNVFLGAEAGWYNTTGSNNIFIGFESGYDNTTGFDNIAIGNKAGQSNLDGTYNVMIGSDAGNNNTTGDYNTLIGYKTGEKTTSNWNTMLGYLAGNSNTSNGSQVMLGYQAGNENTGGWNTMVGSLAGRASGTGTRNTYLGLASGEQATGNDNVFIGRWAGRFESTSSNKLIIESLYEGTDNLNNSLIYGDFSAKYLRINGQILNSVNKSTGYAAEFKNSGGLSNNYGINISAGTTDGTGSYNYLADFNSGNGTWMGSIMIKNGAIGLYQASDARLKENITKSAINALDILKNVQVVDYNFSKSPDSKHTGYIAQDVQTVFPEMVIYNEKSDVYAISTPVLIPVLHKAIIEQQQIIESQNMEIDAMKTELKLIKELLLKNGIK